MTIPLMDPNLESVLLSAPQNAPEAELIRPKWAPEDSEEKRHVTSRHASSKRPSQLPFANEMDFSRPHSINYSARSTPYSAPKINKSTGPKNLLQLQGDMDFSRKEIIQNEGKIS